MAGLLIGKGVVHGNVNGTAFSATYASNVDPETGTGKVRIKGIPKSIGPGIDAWTFLNVTGVCLIGAREVDGGKNAETLTGGRYSRSLAIHFPTGESLRTEASFIKQANGEFQVDVAYSGALPSVQGLEAKPSAHVFMKKGNGAISLAGEMEILDPTGGVVKSAPVMASYCFYSGKSLDLPIKLSINPLKTQYDPVTETVSMEVEETVRPLYAAPFVIADFAQKKLHNSVNSNHNDEAQRSTEG